MKSINTNKNLAIYCFIFLLSINLTTVYAQKTTTEPASGLKKQMSISLSGGSSSSSGHHMTADLKAELLYSLSQHISLGLGIGYIANGNPMTNHHMNGQMETITNHEHNLTVLPLTLAFHYKMPVNESFLVSLKGGGGIYAGRNQGAPTQTSFAYGPHVGIGFDCKIANAISLIADGFYRSVLFDGFDVNGSNDTHDDMAHDDHMDDDDHHMDHAVSHKILSNSFHQSTIANPLHENDGFESPQNKLDISGFGFRLGIRFDL